MKVLLVTLGSHGDIHPFVAIAQALRERGHEAIVATNPYYQAQVAREGVEFAALMEHSDLKEVISNHKVMDATWGPIVVLRKLTLPMVPELVRRTRELIRQHRPDVVVYHPIVLGAPWACALEGDVPTVSISLSPLIWSNPNDAIVLLPFRSHAPSGFAVRTDLVVSRIFLRLALDPGLNRVRRSLGLPKEFNQMTRAATTARRNIGSWASAFRPPLEGDPAHSSVTGFTWHDRDHTQATPDAELLEFLDDGPAPIVFALGSTGVHASGRFYLDAVDATRGLGARALLVVGKGQPPPANLPTDGSIKAVPYAPFSVVFPRASVIVHHGGSGTTAQGLRAGRPTLVTPMAHDQFDNAARVKRLGTSETVRFARVTAKRLRAALEPLLGDARYATAAARLSSAVGAEDGGARAAEVVAQR